MIVAGITIFDVKHIRDVDGELYMWRLTLIKLPSGRSVKLHKIVRSDADRHLHDHPWSFASLILWGGYFEISGPPQPLALERQWYGPGSFRRCVAGHRHRIVLGRRPAWSLFFTGPRVQSWGFYTECGWQHWRAYWDKKVRGEPICDGEEP